jgi:tetratricopeptide (TPR) repeat protein
MTGRTEIKGIIIALLITPILFSCMAKKGIIIPKPGVITAPILPVDIIDKKISMLREFSENKDISPEDRENALSLLSDYAKIRSAASADMSDKDYQEIIRILFSDLSMLDERYLLNKVKVTDQSFSKVINRHYLKEQEILDSYLSADYQRVISKCAELEASFGRNSLTPYTGLLFAMSLAKSNRLTEAIKIGGKIVEELEGRPDLIHLRASIIEWQLDKGNREKAIKLFEKLIDDLDERKAVFESAEEKINNYNKNLRKVEGTAPKDLLKRETGLPGSDGIERLLDEVDSLVKKGAFEEAKLLLSKWRLKTEEGSERETIEQALKSVNLAQEKYRDEASQEKKAIEKATKLIEQENYKDAITGLETLNNDKNAGPEIKKLRDLAIEKLINSERNRAAQIFLMAKNTGDPKKKKELLLSSYNILKELIDTYPSSTLIDKLNNNLSKVEDDLKKFRE